MVVQSLTMMAVVADSHLAAELALDSASHDAETLIRNLEMSLESRANRSVQII